MNDTQYDVAWAAGTDAANRHAREHGRDHWDGSDYGEAMRVFFETYGKGETMK
jgi:hypothetical protein